MPLRPGKSKAAFQANLEAELSAGKPKKQALAIAYAVQRRVKKPRTLAQQMADHLTRGGRLKHG